MKKLYLTCFLLIVYFNSSPAVAQNDPPSFRLTHQIGRGHIQSIEWNPTDDVILVSTIRGAWFYDDLLNDLGHIEAARLATFSPDGTLVAGVDEENRITLWDSNTYTSVGIMPGHEALVTAIAWNPTGDLLATADLSGNLIVWDIGQQQTISTWRISGLVKTLRWKPDGTMLAILITDTAVYVYDVRQAYQIFQSLPTRCCGDDPSVDIAWVDDGTLARLVAGDGNKAELWDVETGDLISEVWPQVNAELWWPSAFSPDATLLAFGNFSVVEIIDRATNEKLYEFDDPLWYVSHLVWSHDSTRLVAIGAYSEIYLWNVSTVTRLAENLEHAQPAPRPIWSMELGDPDIGSLPSWSSDSQLLAIPDRLTAVSIWDIATGEQIAHLEGHDTPVVKVAWYSGSNWLATIQDCNFDSNHASVQIWDGRTGGLIDKYSPGDCPHSIAWRPGDSILVSVGSDNAELDVWDALRRALVQRLAVEPYDPSTEIGIHFFEGVSWSPDGNHIVLTYMGTLGLVEQVFDYPGLTRTTCFGNCAVYNHGHTNSESYAYWSADGQRWFKVSWYKAYAIDMFPNSIEGDPFGVEVTIPFDAQSDEPYKVTLHGHTAPIVDMAANPSGTNLITISQDHEARLWDVFTGETLLILPELSQAAWSPDGTLINGFNIVEGRWHIYDAQNGEVVATLPVSSFDAGYLVWSPDSQKIAQVVDGVVFIWER